MSSNNANRQTNYPSTSGIRKSLFSGYIQPRSVKTEPIEVPEQTPASMSQLSVDQSRSIFVQSQSQSTTHTTEPVPQSTQPYQATFPVNVTSQLTSPSKTPKQFISPMTKSPSKAVPQANSPSKVSDRLVSPSKLPGQLMSPAKQSASPSKHPTLSTSPSKTVQSMSPLRQHGLSSMSPNMQHDQPTSPSKQSGHSMSPAKQAKSPGQTMSPAKEPGQAMSPAKESGQTMSPSRQPGLSMSPAKQLGQVMSPSKQPEQAMAPAKPYGQSSPVKQPGQAMSPAKQSGQAMSPAKQSGQAMLPAKQSGQAMSPAKQSGEAMSPAKQPDQPVSPLKPVQTMSPAKGPGQNISQSKQPAQSVSPFKQSGQFVSPSKQPGPGSSALKQSVQESLQSETPVTTPMQYENALQYRLNSPSVEYSTETQSPHEAFSSPHGQSEYPQTQSCQPAEYQEFIPSGGTNTSLSESQIQPPINETEHDQNEQQHFGHARLDSSVNSGNTCTINNAVNEEPAPMNSPVRDEVVVTSVNTSTCEQSVLATSSMAEQPVNSLAALGEYTESMDSSSEEGDSVMVVNDAGVNEESCNVETEMEIDMVLPGSTNQEEPSNIPESTFVPEHASPELCDNECGELPGTFVAEDPAETRAQVEAEDSNPSAQYSVENDEARVEITQNMNKQCANGDTETFSEFVEIDESRDDDDGHVTDARDDTSLVENDATGDMESPADEDINGNSDETPAPRAQSPKSDEDALKASLSIGCSKETVEKVVAMFEKLSQWTEQAQSCLNQQEKRHEQIRKMTRELKLRGEKLMLLQQPLVKETAKLRVVAASTRSSASMNDLTKHRSWPKKGLSRTRTKNSPNYGTPPPTTTSLAAGPKTYPSLEMKRNPISDVPTKIDGVETRGDHMPPPVITLDDSPTNNQPAQHVNYTSNQRRNLSSGFTQSGSQPAPNIQRMSNSQQAGVIGAQVMSSSQPMMTGSQVMSGSYQNVGPINRSGPQHAGNPYAVDRDSRCTQVTQSTPRPASSTYARDNSADQSMYRQNTSGASPFSSNSATSVDNRYIPMSHEQQVGQQHLSKEVQDAIKQRLSVDGRMNQTLIPVSYSEPGSISHSVHGQPGNPMLGESSNPMQKQHVNPMQAHAGNAMHHQANSLMNQPVSFSMQAQTAISIETQTTNRMQAQTTNPMQAQATNPMQAQATNPLQAQATNPMQAQATNPMQAQATNPMQAQDNNPMHAQPGNQMHGQASNPIQDQLGNPMQTQTGNPMHSQPGNPMEAPLANPMQSQLGNPMQASSGNPMQAQTCNPIQAQISNPMQAQPGNPIQTQPTNPLQSHPCNPIQTQPGNPMQVQSGNHVQVQSGNPMQAQPGNPMQAQPGNPMQVQSGNPAQVHPGNPMQSHPGNPVQAQPGNLMQTQPGNLMPAQPGNFMQTQPGNPVQAQGGNYMRGQYNYSIQGANTTQQVHPFYSQRQPVHNASNAADNLVSFLPPKSGNSRNNKSGSSRGNSKASSNQGQQQSRSHQYMTTNYSGSARPSRGGGRGSSSAGVSTRSGLRTVPSASKRAKVNQSYTTDNITNAAQQYASRNVSRNLFAATSSSGGGYQSDSMAVSMQANDGWSSDNAENSDNDVLEVPAAI